MRIGFDAKRLYNNFTGLGNYSRFIVDSLYNHYPDNKYFLFTPSVRTNADTEHFLNTPTIENILPPPWMSKMKLGSLWRSFQIGHEAKKLNLTIYHGLSNELPTGIPKHVRSIVTIHDLIFLRYPQFYKPLDVAIYKIKAQHACNEADCIVAISEQTANDIVHYLKIDRSKISVVYQGHHPNFNRSFTEQQLVEIKQKYNLPNEFVLNVGTIEERKNVLLVIKALQILKDRIDIPLVIVGKPTKYLDDVKAYVNKARLTNNVLYLHNVLFQDLPALYKLSKIFVYPSLFEGFGIPLVEAIACGVPVITSTGSCFREAAGPSSIYIAPNDEEALAYHIEHVLNHEDQRLQSILESQSYIKKFEPNCIAREMMQVYSTLSVKR